jgi:Cys-tRNA(Pro) deacylase
MEKKSVVEKFKIHYNRGTKKQKTREVLFMEAKDRVYQALCRMAKSDCQITAAALAEELNLKVAASITGEKKIEMINVKDMLKYTGYIRGGCSPIGLKKNYKTYLDKSCKVLKYIIVSAGKIGYQIKISPNDLLNVVSGEVEELTK